MGSINDEGQQRHQQASISLHEVFANNDKPPTLTGGCSAEEYSKHQAKSFQPQQCSTKEELSQLQNVSQFQAYATKHAMAPSLAEFVNYGAEDEESILANREGFARYSLRPRVLRDVSNVDTSTTILHGRVSLSSPVCIAPFAGCRALHPEGEIAVASAAAQCNTIYTIPNWASTPLPTVLDGVQKINKQQQQKLPPLFFQVYTHKPTNSHEGIHREHMKALLEYLATSATDRIVAVVVTCDTVNNGNRERTYKNPQWLVDINEQVGGFPMPCCLQGANLPLVAEEGHSAKMDWKDICWMKQECEKHNLALILKGIMTWEDAVLAAKANVDAIIISNHGGRQLDGTQGTIEVVEECVQAVAQVKISSMMEIYVDGGIRRGKDVAKCLALGAKCVFVGRPILWGLATGGQLGVMRVLDILQNEYREVLQLMGCQSPMELTRGHVVREGEDTRLRITMTSKDRTVWVIGTVCISLFAFALGRSSSERYRR